MGRPFAAILRSRDEEIKNFKLEFDFGQNDDEGDGEPVDFSEQTRWALPQVRRRLRNGPGLCVRERVAKPKACDFRSSRIILQQEILPSRWPSC
jgi:DNA topoisomerase-3